MPAAVESDIAGKPRSLANIVACVVSDATPYTAMLQKRERPKNSIHTWQVKSYPQTGHRGVVDKKPASEFQSNPRQEVQCRAQKTWYNPAVSDFADEAEVVGVKGGSEMAEQIADAIIAVAFQIEKRCLSDQDTRTDDGTRGNETRGALSWVSNTAQGNLPVPSAFRTPSAQITTVALSAFNQTIFEPMAASSFIQRKGPFKMHGFVGINLKRRFTDMGFYHANVSSFTAVGQFVQDATSKKMVKAVDQLVMDSGEIDLHPTAFLATDADSGADTAYTHRSGVFLDMDKAGLCYTRKPRVINRPYDGGGQKAIVDAIFLHMIDNPLGAMKCYINAD